MGNQEGQPTNPEGWGGESRESEKTEEENWLTIHAPLSRNSPAVSCTRLALKPLALFAVRSAPACSNKLLRLHKTQLKPPF